MPGSKRREAEGSGPRRRWLGGTRHGRIIGATLGFPDGSTPNLRRCFTFAVFPHGETISLGRPFRYFRRYPSGPVTKTPTKTPATPLREGYASFTDRVRRVMPLKRFLFRSPLPSDTYSRRRFLPLLPLPLQTLFLHSYVASLLVFPLPARRYLAA